MKKFFTLFAVAALAIPMQAQAFRHTDNVTSTNKYVVTASREALPEGMVLVTLAAGDVWGDGSGYQMLLDADATAYGTIIPASGPLSMYSSVSDEVYAEFEYKIPENADGSLYTENFVVNDAVSILIPAGTYDWCITNPEYAYCMWIAGNFGNINARYDDYVFEAGYEYIFTCYMAGESGDGVDLEIVEGQITPPEPPTPTERTGAPTFNGYTTDGIHAYFIEILPTEPSTIYYRIQYNDEAFTGWAEYEDVLSFTEDGHYRVEAYAVAPGKLESYPISYEFYVTPYTGLSELASGKTVAGVRYFNLAGQEMQEANGMTIVVTTYTDGTTSAVKVMK